MSIIDEMSREGVANTTLVTVNILKSNDTPVTYVVALGASASSTLGSAVGSQHVN